MNKTKPKRILLTGATGSIGKQTIDILKAHPEEFELIGISAGHSKDALEELLNEFPFIEAIGLSVLDEKKKEKDGVIWYGGEDAMARMAKELDYDLLINAVVGFRGLEPTLNALERGIDVALANKESLVCGGDLVKETMKETGAVLRPIDSEHSAIWQCMQGNDRNDIAKLLITASGGALRDKKRDELADVTPAQALKHPSWSMGARITIDSATMVNKGFEVIEAHYLFDLPYEQIEPIIHPQSIVHSMVEYQDGAIMAQMGSADMRLPIQYALFGPKRPYRKEEHPLDLHQALTLNFYPMDYERYPILKTAIEVGKKGGNAGCIFNAADETAVDLFLKGKISFLQIEEAIHGALDHIPFEEKPDFASLKQTDAATREWVRARYL